MGNNKIKSQKQSNKQNGKKIRIDSKILLSSGVVAALIAGVFSLLVSLNTNAKLGKIEQQKYEYELHAIRYEKLREFLSFFSEFQVYDDEFIYNFNIDSEEYSADTIISTMHESEKNYEAKMLQLNAYLSDQALELLESYKIDMESVFQEVEPVDLSELDTIEKINLAYKDHMIYVNSQFSDFSLYIIKVITFDIFNEYVPDPT